MAKGSDMTPEYFEVQPDPERIIEGLRDTGYEFNTALVRALSMFEWLWILEDR